MATVAVKKQSNRAEQRKHATYRSKSQISEALHLIRPYINTSTYKFLSHFLHTDGTGVTQIKITEWCKKVDVSLGAYHKTIKPEIETMFKLPLIIKRPAPMKYDKKRKKKVRASEFKSFMSLSIIKDLIKLKKQEEEQQERLELFLIKDEIEKKLGLGMYESETESETESEITSEIESIPSIPCESKDEAPFSEQQNKSLRVNHVEKVIKKKEEEKESILENDSFSSQSDKKYFFKKETKAILKEAQKQVEKDGFEITPKQVETCGNEIQKFSHDYKLKVIDIHEMAVDVIYTCINSDYYNFGPFLYKSLENAFFEEVLEQQGVDIEEMKDNQEYDELNELREEMKVAYKEGVTAMAELATAFEARPKKKASQAKRGRKKATRTELLPSWFGDFVKKEREKDEKRQQEQEQKPKMSIEEMLKALRDSTSPETGLHAF